MIPKKIKRGMAIFMLLLFILSPLKTSAHESYFLQVLIDTKTFSYTTAVLNDDDGTFGAESGHIESKFGDFRNLIGNEYLALPSDQWGDVFGEPNGANSKVVMPFTFPPIEDGVGWFDGIPKNHADQDDVNRAYVVKDTLTFGLNDALFVLNGGQMFESTEEFLKASAFLSSAISQSKSSGTSVVVNGSNGFTLQVGKRASGSQNEPNDLKNGVSNSDYLVITDGYSEHEYVYRMQKGYAGTSKTLESGFDWDNKVWDSRYTVAQGDIGYVTWNAMMYQGFYALISMNMDASESGAVAHVGPLEDAVRWMLQSIFSGIRNLLGLYSMNELIYNDGIRGSAAWHYGIMPDAWEDNVMFYHWIFQAFAWSLISFSIVKLLISRNLATINPSARVSLIEGIKDLLITGVILSFIMPLLNMLFMLNEKIVDVFAAVGPNLDEMTGLNEFTGMLAGVLMQFFYLIILIWLNFTYIVRSITIAVLTVLAPIFVVTLSLGGKWKGLFMNWMREMVSNIFIQSFHAFLIGFLYLSQISSRGIELAVICFAMIPLTEFFRGMVLGGQSGDVASKVGMSSLSALGGVASASMKNAKNPIGNSKVSSGGSTSTSDSRSNGGSGSASGSDSGKVASAGGDMKTGSSEKLKQNQAQAQAQSQSRTKHQDIRNAQMEKQVPLDIQAKGKDSEEYQRFMGAQPYSEHEAKVMDFKENLKNDYMSKDAVKNAGMGLMKGVAKAAVGGMGVGLGAGYALAMGGMNPNAVKDGLKIAGRSAQFMTKGAGAGTAKVYGDMKTGYQLARDGLKNRTTSTPVRTTVGGAQALPGGTKALPGGATKGSTMSSGASTAGANNAGGAMVVGGSPTNGGNQSIPQGADLGGAIYANSIGKGNSEVYRDGTVLSEQGILRGHEDDNGNAVFVYDESKFGVSNQGGSTVQTQDYHNLQNYKNTFQNGTQEQKDYLRSQGIENVAATGDGHLAVVYNQAGKEAMGIKNVRMSGGNMIETKRADQPMATRASVTVPPMPVAPQGLPQGQRQYGGRNQSQGRGSSQTQRQQRQGQTQRQDGQQRANRNQGQNRNHNNR